jgi:transcriptional regulator with XRE-family HTH domain
MSSHAVSERYSADESTDWLSQRMKKLKISTYEELSELVGLDRGTISRYFSHKRRPSIDVIAQLCQALQVSPETLLIALGALDKK